MDRFEWKLSQEMKRAQVPAGFADRVVKAATASAARPVKVQRWPVRQRWLAGALAAMMLLGVSFGAEQEHHRRQREAERQFVLAMKVTSQALEQTREQLSRAGFRLVNETKDQQSQ